MFSLSGASRENTTPGRRTYPLQKTIVFAAPAGLIPFRLKAAIENELHWAVVSEVPRVEDACVSFGDSVSIILADVLFLNDIERLAPDLRRVHPLAPVLLIARNGMTPSASLPAILDSRIVKGILPVNISADLLISVICMMLRGGEYFPRQWFRPTLRPEPDRAVAKTVAKPPIDDEQQSIFLRLTRREYEILRLVAKGLQNKSIAAALNLSEHTVKIHTHNIITKLGAHNRTQASAMFRDYQEATAPSA